jgi:ABC-type glycerol-3-phosphate transport system substrate-binding protein
MRFLKVAFLLLLLGTIGSPMLAQTSTNLVIALPDWWEGQFDETVFDDFESQHIGVDVAVNFVSSDDMFFTPAQFDVEEHINKTIEYATKGDVLYTGSYQLTVEATRAGAYLDLSPLTVTDSNLDTTDFLPALWQSFQWDGGMWAIPMGGSFIMNIYNKNALDEANIPYPDSTWTITEYANYARELTTYKASGEVDTPGFNSYYTPALFYSLLNRGIYDMSTFPETANLMSDDIIDLLSQWTALLEENVVNPFGEIDFDDQDVPLHVEQTWRVMNRFMDSDADWQASLLSNNRAGLQVEGFAVSGGTDYPELAYELIMYMSQSVDIRNHYFFDTPARKSMVGVENKNSSKVFGEKPPELQSLLEEATVNAIPISEMRYYGYLDMAIQSIRDEGKSVENALIETQQLLDENLLRAAEMGAETAIFVESPASTPALAEGEIVLNFALNTLFSPVPNRDDWERIAQEFAESDLEVGLIDFSFGFKGIQEVAKENDCFYRQLNDLRNAPLDQILVIEPFLNADMNFIRDDILTGILDQVTRDSQIWGMPMNATPNILWVNTRLFEEAGVPIPNAQWTVTEFVDALNQLASLTEDAPYSPHSFGGDYMLTLITAFGGLIDDPSNPDNIPNLTSEKNKNAIRQALDLAKNGLIDYDELATFGGGGGGGFNTDDTPIYDANLSSMDFRFQQRRDNVADTFQATLFPSGTQYTPITLEVGSAYISANSPYADACYRWLSHLAENPELFDGMPVRRSKIASAQTQGSDIYELYTAIDSALDDPNTVIFPFKTTNQSAFFFRQWIFRAFDAYVLEDVYLDDALAQSQQLIDDYTICIEPTRNIDTATLVTKDEQADYYMQLNDCAIGLDPAFADLFGGGG